MTLKKLSMIVLAAGALSVGAYIAHAQHGNPQEMIDHRIDRLKSELNLTGEQVSKIKTIFEQAEPAMTADRNAVKAASNDGQKQAAEEKMHSEMENVHSQVSAVLTPEQQKKYTEMMSKHEGHAQGAGSEQK